MNAKEYLIQLKNVDNMLKALRDDLDRTVQVVGVHGVNYSYMPHSKGYTSDRTGNEAINVTSLEMEIHRQIKKYVDLKLEVMKLIDKLDDVRHKAVLYNYYVQNRTLTQTAEEMHRSYQNICTLHNAALAAFQKLMEIEGVNEQQNH